MKLAFIVWSCVALLPLGIGIKCYTSRKPVGFFSNVEPPRVKDVKMYNQTVSKLWMFYAFGLEILGIPLLFTHQNSPLFIIPVLGVVFMSLGLIICYTAVEGRYKEK